MYKELIISIIVIISIFGLNFITQKNTDETVEIMKSYLEEVKKELEKQDVDYKLAYEKANKIHDKWEELDDRLAFYVEHEEIEKVKTAIVSMQSFTKMEDDSQAIDAIDRCMYILEHIDEREKMTLDNIF